MKLSTDAIHIGDVVNHVSYGRCVVQSLEEMVDGCILATLSFIRNSESFSIQSLGCLYFEDLTVWKGLS